MENLESRNSNTYRDMMINELRQGSEYAKQLHEINLDLHTQKLLIQKICSSYTNVLSMINNTATMNTTTPPPPASPIMEYINSSMMMNQNHQLEHGGRTLSFKPHGYQSPPQQHQDDEQASGGSCNKKRKMMPPKWSEEVRICCQESPERSGGSGGLDAGGALNDGYSWRKYGQKDILGAKYPRNYYRCTHRNTLGCPATKQIQKSDKDPTLIRVIYRGHHTCRHQPASTDRSAPPVQPLPLPDHGSSTPQIISQLMKDPKTEDGSYPPRPDERDGFIFGQYLSFSATPFYEPAADQDHIITNYEQIFSASNAEFIRFTDYSAGPDHNVGSGRGTPDSESSDAASAKDSVNGSSSLDVEGFDFSLEDLGIDPDLNFDSDEFFT